jgi:hypothetical protein
MSWKAAYEGNSKFKMPFERIHALRQELYTYNNHLGKEELVAVPLKIPFARTMQNYLNELQHKKTVANAIAGWSFSEYRLGMIHSETHDWMKHYLPIDLRGKVVLDIGAGEGETAMFFLQHGASKVVCIEAEPEAYSYLEINQRKHPKTITAIHSKFEPSHLKIPHDFLKMDIEGYEEAILGIKLENPAVLEVHGLQLCDKFEAQGWRIHTTNRDCAKGYGCVRYAYWKC